MSTWTPLESNPDVLTKYIHKLGVPAEWSIQDVVGLDDEMLEWVPRPLKALILLFPISDAYEKHRSEEHERLTAEPEKHDTELYYMRQLTHNACGTVAIIHGIANNKEDIKLNDGVLKNFLAKAETLNAEQRGEALENDSAFTETHQALAQEGQTDANVDKVNHHFITFVNLNGVLYELDGRKSFPIKHGKTDEQNFLRDAAKICKEFMARDPNELRFTVLALAATQD